MRTRFWELHCAARDLRRRNAESLHAEQARFDAAAYSLARSRRKRGKPTKREVREAAESLWEDWRERFALPLMEANRAAEKAAEAAADEAARVTVPRLTLAEGWRVWRTVDAYTYATQGLGAASYARNAAHLAAIDAEAAGIPARVVESRIGKTLRAWQVWVATDAEGCAILDRAPKLDLREWLVACWRRAINPRVLDPFLPVGLEEKLGVGWQGQDLRAKRGECRALALR